MRHRLELGVLAGALGAGIALGALPLPAHSAEAPPAPARPVDPTRPLIDPAQPLAGALPTLALADVRAGQRGYGLSVFSGGQPERFEVEVIGVMRNVSPDVSYVLARLTGKNLEKSGVIAGMSGSPVFIDGKLVGAVSFSWPFSQEAIAGITPIELMRRLAGMGVGEPGAPGVPLPPVPLSDLAAGRVPADLLSRQLTLLAPKLAGGAVPSLQWSTIGFGERSLGLLRQALGPVAPAGQMMSGGPTAGGQMAPGGPAVEIVPGGSVAAVLVDGDFSLAATGTVTDRIGDRVFAFGHPFLALGPTRVPMAEAEVVTVLASQYSSFKIANIGTVVGAFEQDRQAGIQGRLGLQAPMVPMVLRVKGGLKPREFHMRLAEVQQVMALMVGSTTIAGLEAASYTAGPLGVDLTARFDLVGHGQIEVHQSFDGDNAGGESAAYLTGIAGYLAQNTLERVKIAGIDAELVQAPQPRAAELVGANADHTVVRPGQRVALNLDLVPYRGEAFRHSLSLDLPEDLPDGRYSLLVGDGASADAARLSIAPVDPVNIEQALDLLRSLHSRRQLVVLGIYGGPGLAVAGEVMPRLPGSVRSLWGAAASGSAVPLRMAIAQEHDEAMPVPIKGLVRIDLEVRHRDALNQPGADASAPQGGPGSTPPGGPDSTPDSVQEEN